MLRFGISGIYFCTKIKYLRMILSNTYIKNESALRKYFLGNIRLNWTFG